MNIGSLAAAPNGGSRLPWDRGALPASTGRLAGNGVLSGGRGPPDSTVRADARYRAAPAT